MAEGILELSVADTDSGPVVTVSGQADYTTADLLSKVLTDQLARGLDHLVVDASELDFADSMTIRTLVLAALTLKDRGGGMVLLHPRPPVARMLALVGADQVVTVDAGS